ncbi:hypothetical protein L3Q82_003749 [Scortum barcoo]|uniref:Uncharacterized protein n=1 Tax=Scortum barcoo TaxID=214431 RepID=A0ACB8X6R2_9TELE|nr:hypothetical protein L3Q82_003749 [Scortum barcoo]
MDAKDGVRFKRLLDESRWLLKSCRPNRQGAGGSLAGEGARRAGRAEQSPGGHNREPAGAPGRSWPGAQLKEIISTMQHKQKQAGERGRRAEREEEEEDEDRGRGDAGGRKEVRSKRSASEGGEGGERAGRLRWRVHQLEKEKLQLTSVHNQEVCRLQAELTRLRSSVERGEAQQVELQYQLTVSRRDADRAAELTASSRAPAVSRGAAESCRTSPGMPERRTGRLLQQEAEERDGLIRNLSSENQRLLRLLQKCEAEADRKEVNLGGGRSEGFYVLQDQEEVLEESGEEDGGAEEGERERGGAVRSEAEVSGVKHRGGASSSPGVKVQLCVFGTWRQALAVERSGQQEAQFSLREVERAFSLERERSAATERALQQTEYEQCKSDLSVALETEKKMNSDLTESLSGGEEASRQHTHTQLEQAEKRRSDSEEAFMIFLKHITETLQQHNNTTAAEGDAQQLPTQTQETTDRQLQDLLFASERLQEENQTLRQLTSDQSRQLEEAQQVSVRLEEEVTRLRLESSDWSTQRRDLQAELEREREERGGDCPPAEWTDLCEKKSVCVRELQRSQECVLSRLEAKREEEGGGVEQP